MKYFLTLFLFLAFSTGAFADNLKKGVYISTHFAGNEVHLETDTMKDKGTSFAWLIAIGVRSRYLRTEIEVGDVPKAKIDNLRVNQQRYMLQGYYDVPLPSPVVRPFLNLGAGATYTEIYHSQTKKNTDKTAFTWNVGGGIALNVNSFLSFDVGYRYLDTGKPKFSGESVKVNNHEVYAGVRYTF